MPDATGQLRADLQRAIAADTAITRTGSPTAVRARARRRRRTHGLLAGTVAMAVAAVASVAFVLPTGGSSVPSRLATDDTADPGVPVPYLLDEGTAADGPWTLVITEQHCIEHTRPRSQGGVCDLDEAGRLQDTTSFRTEDDGTPVVLVNGTVQDGTSLIIIEMAGRPAVQVTPVRVDGRLYFSARTPSDASITGLAAVDDSGGVLARAGGLPPPPP